MKRIVIILLLFVCVACGQYDSPHLNRYEHTLILTCLGNNDLSGDISNNLYALEKDILPFKNYKKAIVVFSHLKQQSPVLYQLYQKDGKAIRDTLKIYDDIIINDRVLNTVFRDIQNLVASDSYGLLFSSHSTAWMPSGYSTSNNEIHLFSHNQQEQDYPRTKSMSQPYEIDIKDFVNAIPFHLDYFIADTCLMSSIEVMWEFKDICDYFLASPTEVLSEGFLYSRLSRNLLSVNSPNLEQIALDYFNLYDSQSGQRRSATITLVDCRKLENLSAIFSTIIKDRDDEILAFNYRKAQTYGWRSSQLCYFFDFQDFVHKLGASERLLYEFDSALNEAIIMHRETPEFIGLKLNNCCGISVYIPYPGRNDLTNYYKNLSWSKDTKYLYNVYL